MRTRTAALATGFVLSLLAAGAAVAAQPAYVAAAVADAGRPDADRQRDPNRKPAEVLAFAGVKPGDKVGEIMPGGGYYTRLLSKIVGPTGKVYAIVPERMLSARPESAEALKAIGPNVVVVASPDMAPPASTPEKLDLVWTSENYHDFHGGDIAAFNKQVITALKPGGVFLVEDHAAAATAGPEVTRTLHRINPNQARTELTAAGFRLEAESDVLKNPADDGTKPTSSPDLRGKTQKFLFRLRKPN